MWNGRFHSADFIHRSLAVAVRIRTNLMRRLPKIQHSIVKELFGGILPMPSRFMALSLETPHIIPYGKAGFNGV